MARHLRHANRTQPTHAAAGEYQCRHNDRCVKDHARAHACLRAHEVAAVTSSSSIPSWERRARTSSARLFCSGRRMMHAPSVLTSKYSTPVKRATTFLGRVIWFLVVFFASMDTSFKEKKETRKSYHSLGRTSVAATDFGRCISATKEAQARIS